MRSQSGKNGATEHVYFIHMTKNCPQMFAAAVPKAVLPGVPFLLPLLFRLPSLSLLFLLIIRLLS